MHQHTLGEVDILGTVLGLSFQFLLKLVHIWQIVSKR